MKKILMVCLGNICRSPVAEGVMNHVAEKNQLKIYVDSAGTSGWHNGEAPDKRSSANALLHGIDIRKQKSREVHKSDFEDFDLIFAMDESNYNNLMQLCPQKHQHKIKLLLNELFPAKNKSVPDPYYTSDGFEEVFQLINNACEKIALKLKNNEY